MWESDKPCLWDLALSHYTGFGVVAPYIPNEIGGMNGAMVSDLYEEQELGQSVQLGNGLNLTVQSMEVDNQIVVADSYDLHALVVTVEVNNSTPRSILMSVVEL